MKEMVKMVSSIVIFAALACIGLAVVDTSTKERIAANKAEVIKDALGRIFPGADFEDRVKIESANKNVKIDQEAYVAKKDGKIEGIAIQASRMGFSAVIEAMVGVGADGRITGVRILKDTDTPGLGANAASESYFVDSPADTKTFFGQFSGMPSDGSLKVKKDGGEIIAITAATISSRYVTELVNSAAKAGSEYLAKNGGSN